MIFDIKMFDVNRNIVVVESVGYESVLKHRHSFVEIVYVHSGEAFNYVGDETVRIEAGNIFVIADNSEHYINPICKGEGFKITNIICTHELLKGQSFPGPADVFSLDDAHGMIEEIKKEYDHPNSNEYILLLLIRNLINRCLIEKEHGKREKTKKIMNKRSADSYIKSAVDFIHENYNMNLKVNDVAVAVGLYPSYLQKVFLKYRSTSIYEYITHYRMEKACQFLSETNLPVEKISHMVGIKDLKNFYKTFKQNFNMTPRQYRDSHRY